MMRNDTKRILFFYKNADSPIKEDVSEFVGFLHPIFAVLLSLFDGKKDIVSVSSDFEFLTGVNQDSVKGILYKLIENKKEILIKYAGYSFVFPQNTLVPADSNHELIYYDPHDFLIPSDQLDFEQRRLYDPLDTMLMLNNICVTNCIYCYIDKSKAISCKLPFERIVELIQEARQIGMRSFNPTGGELFTYRYWKELLTKLVEYQYDPYITTKYPLNNRRIKELKDTGIKRINLSIDTIDRDIMKQMLNVDSRYYDLIFHTLKELNDNNFEICIHSQINSLNQDNMEELFHYLLQVENIRCIKVRATAFSRFQNKNDIKYSHLRPDKSKLEHIKEIVLGLMKVHKKRVEFYFHQYPERSKFINSSPQEKQSLFERRAQCSGNFHSFFILPDGKVTICEEMFWHPQFIIGDLMKHSIREVWNSEKALNLYNITRNKVRSQSACKKCLDFDSCHMESGVCWKQVIYAYGEKNWDFPDPRCPNAPMPQCEFWIE